jgi:hypothetical protein
LVKPETRSTKLPVDDTANKAILIDEKVAPVTEKILMIERGMSFHRFKPTKARDDEAFEVRVDPALFDLYNAARYHLTPSLQSKSTSRLIELSAEPLDGYGVHDPKSLSELPKTTSSIFSADISIGRHVGELALKDIAKL